MISGTYTGETRDSTLVLRLDVDGPNPLDMVSGELVQPLDLAEFNVFETLTYSFLGHDVSQRVDGGRTIVTAEIQFPRLPGLRGDIEIESRTTSTVARLHLTGYGYHAHPFVYSLRHTSPHFRSVRLEIDVQEGIDYPVRWRPHADGPEQVPEGFPAEPVTIPTCFERAGIEMIVASEQSIVPNTSAGSDARWTSAELHAAMTSFFSTISDDPGWNVWFMVASAFETPGVSGIMFDSEIGAPRQGAAVFWDRFKDLPKGVRERDFIRTSVHELGHAMNLLHSFQKGVFAELAGIGTNLFMVPRSDALSFMNYPWRYPHGHNRPAGWNGTPDYWSRFRFEFDRLELFHLRHHDQLEVAFGGEPFGGEGHAIGSPRPSGPLPAAAAEANEASPIELELRAKRVGTSDVRVYDLMEPVRLELKVSAKPDRQVATVAEHLDPAHGTLAAYVRTPGGDVARFAPVLTLCSDDPAEVELGPGEARYANVDLTYGRNGFTFAEPGAYRVRVVYLGGGGMTTYSNELAIRVATPKDQAHERAASEFFDPVKGELLAVGPSGSKQFESHVEDLAEIASAVPDTAAGRALGAYVASSAGRPFVDVTHERTAAGVEADAARLRAAPKTSAGKLAELLIPVDEPSASLSNLSAYELHRSRIEMLATTDDAQATSAAVDDAKAFVARAVPDNDRLREAIVAEIDRTV